MSRIDAAFARLRRDVLSVVSSGMEVLREEAMAQSAKEQERRVKLLEERVHKLKGVLDATGQWTLA